MTDVFQISPGRWASIRNRDGMRSLYTFTNPRGDGFETYTALTIVKSLRGGLDLEGDIVHFSDDEMQTILATAEPH